MVATLLFSFRDHGSCMILSLLVDGVVFNTMFYMPV